MSAHHFFLVVLISSTAAADVTTTEASNSKQGTVNKFEQYASFPIDLTSYRPELGVITGKEQPFASVPKSMPYTIKQIGTQWLLVINNGTSVANITLDNIKQKLDGVQLDRLYVYSHGYGVYTETFKPVVDGLLNVTEHHGQQLTRTGVLYTDWRNGSNPEYKTGFTKCQLEAQPFFCFYGPASLSTVIVGRHVAVALTDLLKMGVIDNPKQIHIIGFSLGAHVTKYATRFFKQLNGGATVDRVTYLDIAGPNFEKHPDTEPVREATFSEVVYSSPGPYDSDILDAASGRNAMNRYGQQLTIFVNEGAPQPWCHPVSMFTGCSHNVAPLVYFQAVAEGDRPTHACLGWNGTHVVNKTIAGAPGVLGLGAYPMNITDQTPVEPSVQCFVQQEMPPMAKVVGKGYEDNSAKPMDDFMVKVLGGPRGDQAKAALQKAVEIMPGITRWMANMKLPPYLSPFKMFNAS